MKKNKVHHKKADTDSQQTESGKNGKEKSTEKPSARKKNPIHLVFELKKIFWGILILSAICLALAMIADIYFSADKAEKTSSGQYDAEIDKSMGQEAFKDILKDEQNQAEDKPAKVFEDKLPKIALIIDDIGYNRKVAMAIFKLNSNITLSILPWSPFAKSISNELTTQKGHVMLHLPMEPNEYPKVDPGPGALFTSMSPDELLNQLKKNLSQITGVKGVNNHMGSRFTASADQMNQIFSILKKRNLFFIDSMTSKKSQCLSSARLLRIRFAKRDIFLDNSQDAAYILGQLERLVQIAEKHGSAIGIGHPYKITMSILEQNLPQLTKRAHIVPVEDLVHVLDWS